MTDAAVHEEGSPAGRAGRRGDSVTVGPSALPTAARSVTAAAPAGVARRMHNTVVGRLLRHRLAVGGLVILVGLSVTAFSANLWLPYERVLAQVRTDTFAPPSADSWFGRDEYGRDAFARAAYAGQVSLGVALVSALIATIVGTVLGALAGYVGGATDALVDRVIELFLTLPSLLLLILAAAVARPSVQSITIILSFFSWPVLARIVRGEFLTGKERDYVQAAETVGCSRWRIAIRHILPNAMAPIIVTGTLLFATNLTAEAAISFLGLGIQPPTPSWGNMLTNAQDYVISSPFLAVFPGLLILVAVLCINLVGDGLRDALDPRLRGQ
jgi:peptide/nickel transport system permease protein